MSSKFLYRRWGPSVIALVAFLAVVVFPAVAQRPQLKRPEPPAERPPAPPKKKVKGPRAVAILQFREKSTTLIPVAILVDGRFYDASAYKAEPVPMALERGTVYEAEQTGESQGLFTINGALHSKSPNSVHPWMASGSYLANGTEAAKTTRKAEDKPVGIDSSGGDEPPRLTRGSGSKPASNDTAPTAKAGSGSPGGSGAAEKPAASAPPGASPPASGASSGTSSGKASGASPGQEGQGPASPAASDKTQKAQVDQPSPSPEAGNYYRPTLRRGKPTEPAPQEPEEEGQSGKAGGSAGSATAAANVPPVKLVPAISDEGGQELRSYTFFWKPGEEDDRRTQMLALAATDVRNYAAALVKNRILAKAPGTKTAAAHKSAKPPKPVQPDFEDINFRAFDLWGKSQPVMVLTAEAHLPAAAGATTLLENYSITLAATTDIYGNLRPLYTGVTDKFHLDVTPELHLIDAVDADGDGRGELLFGEKTDAGSGYVIYRATADKLWKLFDSLGEQ